MGICDTYFGFMNRFMLPLGMVIALLAAGCGQSHLAVHAEKTTPQTTSTTMTIEKVIKTDAEWHKLLTPEQYRIAREKGTERAFTGVYNGAKEKGVYTCVCC